jgi:uncharacterized protein (DUF433 family)
MSDKRVVITGGILFGKPRIKGTRISVEQVLACMAEGWSNTEIMKEFEITEEDIKAAVDFAHQSLSRTQFLTPSEESHAELSD